MHSVTACALNLPNTTQTLTGTMHSVSICALHKTNTATVHSVTICAPSRNTTRRTAVPTLIKVSRRVLGMHSESRARATRVETTLAVLLCANSARAAGKIRPLRVHAQHGMHVQRSSSSSVWPHWQPGASRRVSITAKEGSQTRLGCFVPCYRDYPQLFDLNAPFFCLYI